MPRSVQDAKLDSRAARARLPARGKPYYRALDHELHLGYRRAGVGGRWVVRVYLGNQQYRVETIGTADDRADADGIAVLDWRQAQAKARERRAEIAHQAVAAEAPEPVVPITIADVVTEYLVWIEQHRRPSTAREWGYVARGHILPALGKLEVARLAAERLQQWHEALAAAPALVRTRKGDAQRYRKPNGDPDVSRARRSTANHSLAILKAALNHAWLNGKIEGSDAAWRRAKPFRGVAVARVRYLQIEECTRLLNACPPDFRQLVRGALVTGARYGELCRANVGDFNPDAAALHVHETKSGRPRHIPLDDEAAEFLLGVAAGRQAAEPLFVRTNDKRWAKSEQRLPLLTACKAARIEPAIGFHALRHTWASLRIMSGMPLMVAGRVLGHADTRMVEKHYGHLAQSYVHEQVRATALRLGPVDATVTPIRRSAT